MICTVNQYNYGLSRLADPILADSEQLKSYFIQSWFHLTETHCLTDVTNKELELLTDFSYFSVGYSQPPAIKIIIKPFTMRHDSR